MIKGMECVARRHGITIVVTSIVSIPTVGAHEGIGQGTIIRGVVSGGRIHPVSQV